MNMRAIHWFKFASPQNFYHLAGKLWPWFAALATGLTLIGIWIAFFVAPVDAQQGQGYRIIFVHVPASQMAMFIYMVMAGWAGVQHPVVGHGGLGPGPDRRTVCIFVIADRRAMGQADVGGLVGVGCAADIDADFAVFIPRLYGAAGQH